MRVRTPAPLLPDTLDEAHRAARVIDVFADSSDLKAPGFGKGAGKETGSKPHHRGALLKLCVYGYSGVGLHFLTQASFRPDAIAITSDQHDGSPPRGLPGDGRFDCHARRDACGGRTDHERNQSDGNDSGDASSPGKTPDALRFGLLAAAPLSVPLLVNGNRMSLSRDAESVRDFPAKLTKPGIMQKNGDPKAAAHGLFTDVVVIAYAVCLRLAMLTSPSRPEPKSHTAAGTGT